MSSNLLKVQELRDALAERGLDTSGTKPVLVARLNAHEEAKTTKKRVEVDRSEPDDDPAVSSMKRAKNHPTPEESTVEEDIDGLTVAELLSALATRGLSTAGTKKTLRSRLSEALNTSRLVHNVKDDDDNGKEHCKEEKIVVSTKKGRAVLDNYLPDTVKSRFHVLETDKGIYDAMLNQTSVGDNNNKFYVIQALESDSGAGQYYLYTRWGRVGARGQDKLFGPYSAKDDAITEFEAKFLDKTKNEWADRLSFKPVKTKYTWLQRDYSDDVAEASESKANRIDKKLKSLAKTPQGSKLESRVAQFITHICNFDMMKQQMMEMGYDVNKMPLGKLSKATIFKGYESLKNIAAVLEGSAQGSLEQLSSDFYTVIPHDFGFQKMRSFIIDSHSKLKKKLEMVEALGEIQLSTKLLQDGDDEDDPVYSHYGQLNCHLEPLEYDCEELNWITQYFNNTSVETNAYYGLELLQVFKARREVEIERFKKFANVKNRMLLWHGSRLTNWTGILSQGLRIAPPEAPACGHAFGKGVYFADMVSMSAGYCFASRRDPIGVILLCEVALGDMQELQHPNYKAGRLPAGKLSTKGMGRTEPNPKESKVLPDGLIVPMGKPVEKQGDGGFLFHNQYIVYNVAQIRMRYVLQVKFNYPY